MSLSGGPADKFGNRYEGVWTVSCMVDVLEEGAGSIRLEPPGAEGEGAEFWVSRGGALEYHQVKRQHGAQGRWTLNDLGSREVLSRFWDKLGDPTASCVFVSTHAAYELDELTDRARRAVSFAEFDREFLGAEQRRRFDRLRALCGGPDGETTFERLRRIHVKTVDEDTLVTIVDARLAALVDGEPSTIRDVLAQLALDRVHHELIAHDVWRHLEDRGLRRRDWANDAHVLARVDRANVRYLDPLRERTVAGMVIPREETEAVLGLIDYEDAKRGVLLAGGAGVGKSGVVFQVLEELKERNVPFLAFRVDRLNPTVLPEDIGGQLSLPGSPAAVLAAVAQGRDCALVIDQLDAVSLASGRHPGFFDSVDEVIHQALAHPRMRVLLACRRFDLDNDHRLRRLTGERGVASAVDIQRLPEARVREAVAAMGIEAGGLNARQLELLSVPLHLSLLAEIAEIPAARELNFQTAKDLYDLFWERKRDLLSEHTGRSVRWTKVVDALCDHMSERQVLSAPAGLLDDHEEDLRDDARAMVSENVLVRDGGRYAFFHEGFFDYAFARRFASCGREFLPFLRGGEQHLFRRAQVRQVLLHEREADRAQYLADLSALLNAPDIRFHIKHVVFALLAGLGDATKEEWDVLAPFLDAGEEPYVREVHNVLTSAPWFRLVDSLGLWERWLAEESEERLNRTTWVLRMVQKEEPDRVAELVEPYIGVPGWRDRIAWLTGAAELHTGRRFFDLFLKAIDEGVLDDADAAISLYGLPDTNPKRACEALYHYLKRRFLLGLAAGQSNPFDRSSGTVPRYARDEDLFAKSAQRAPKAFVTELLPFMLSLAALLAEREGDPPYKDPVWGTRYPGGGHFTEDALLFAMETALRDLAKNEPATFDLFARLLRDSDVEVAQYLLVRSYAANGERYADEAVEYLLERPRRLETGYANEPHWATRELLAAVSPHCSDENMAKLEELVLGYYSEWELSESGRAWRGDAQLTLLGGIAPSRLSSTAAERLKKWREKFGGDARKPAPQVTIAEWVGSPIPEEKAESMTDEEWLEAISHYSDERRAESDSPLEGGAHQLSGVLERRVKEEPQRFAELVLRFPDDAHHYYFEAVLRGVAEARLEPETLLKVCRRCHELPGRPCGRWICDAVGKAAGQPLPEELLEMVAWYATEDADPDREMWRTEAWGGLPYYGGSVFGAGMNSARGEGALALASLISRDADLVPFYLDTLERMVRDPSTAVRSCGAATLTAVCRHDRDLAVDLFLRLCETEDALLGTHPTENFLYYATATHFERLKPILERMVSSDDPEVAAAGSRQACLASLDAEGATPLARKCLSGTEAQRVGAAQVFAANLKTARFRSVCEAALRRLFDDDSEEVRSEASKCFFGFENDQLGEYTDLAEAFVESPAFSDGHEQLTHALERTIARLPVLVCLVCERFLEVAGRDAADIRTAAAATSDTAVQLLVRAYGQSRDPELDARCLDVFDRMVQIGVYGLDKALGQYER